MQCGYSYEDVASHPLAVLLPYSMHSYGLVQAYAMGIPLLAPEELQQFNTLLLRKTWERREDLQLVARRFTAKLLDQTAQRVLNSKR